MTADSDRDHPANTYLLIDGQRQMLVPEAEHRELRQMRSQQRAALAQHEADLHSADAGPKADLERRERIQVQLQNIQRLESLGQLAGGIVHDFNNLLGVIMGYSSILQRRVDTADPMHNMLVEVTEAAQLAAHLTRQLTTFSRSSVLSVRLLDLNEVINGVINMLRRLAGDDVSIQTQLTDLPLIIEADLSQLEQMLMNLVVNSRDAMLNGGTLRVETHLVAPKGLSEPPCDAAGGATAGAATHVMLCVADTGVGISTENQSKIFEPFFTTKAAGGGTGLGLSTVHGIVTKAGGTIEVDSEPDAGATFNIMLPLAAGDPADPVSSDDAAHTVMPNRRCLETVLLVEDRIRLRALVAAVLGEAGYKVLVAHDTDDAVRLAAQHPGKIHVLVTDVVMPKRSGPDLANTILAERRSMKVLFMSGVASDPLNVDKQSPEEMLRASERGWLAAGDASFISKPFTPDDLQCELRRLLD